MHKKSAQLRPKFSRKAEAPERETGLGVGTSNNESAVARESAVRRTVRRLAAILAADVVGYSGKIEADESSTLAALKDVQATLDPLLAGNSGRIVKTMGDGLHRRVRLS